MPCCNDNRSNALASLGLDPAGRPLSTSPLPLSASRLPLPASRLPPIRIVRRFTDQELHAAAKLRLPGYADAVYNASRRLKNGLLEIEKPTLLQLQARYPFKPG
jgi:hypothetical protein